jgi:predicted transcriptional regulator
MMENWPLQLDFTAAVVVNVPADAQEGTYSIILAVKDPEGRTLVEALVTVAVDNSAPVLPADLGVAAADIHLSPDPATEGTQITLEVTIRNLGSSAGTGMMHISDINGTAIWTQNMSLEAGGMLNFSCAWNPTAGNHTVEVTVQTLSGGNRDSLNDLATRTFFILPGTVPPPPKPRLTLLLDSDSVTVAPGGSISVTVRIICSQADASGVFLRAVPSGGLRVDVEILTPPVELRSGEDWTSQLRIMAPSSLGNSSRSGTLEISVIGAGAIGDTRSLIVSIAEAVPVKSGTSLAAIGAVAALSVVVLAAVAIGWTEVGLVALTSLLLPLYSKIRKEEVLDQFTRGKIQGYITAYPGEHYNSIKVQLGIKNGALAYHLKVLEREGYVSSIRDGVYKRYYPKETILPLRRGQFSQMQEMVLGHIRESPGISQDGLARAMKVSNQVVYYHVRNLMAAGAVRLEKDGKQTHCYINGFEGSGS